MNIKATLGKKGELLVARHLEKNGFNIVTYNYRERVGEIDLIASNRDLLLFVEVKLRNTHYFDPTLVITRTKQKKIIATAKGYLSRHKIFDKVCRFDVALVHGSTDAADILYLEDAFRDGE